MNTIIGFSFEQNLENALLREFGVHGFQIWNDINILRVFGDDITGVDFYCRYYDFIVTIKCNMTNTCLTDMTNFIYGSAIIKETLKRDINNVNVHKIYVSNVLLTNAMQTAATRKNVHIIIDNNQQMIINAIIRKINEIYQNQRQSQTHNDSTVSMDCN